MVFDHVKPPKNARIVEKKRKKKLKLQAAMEGTSPGSPPTGGFRKTRNGEQYAFKKVNIEVEVEHMKFGAD